MPTIQLGNKDLKEMTVEELTEFMIFEGLFQKQHKIDDKIVQFWETPVITKHYWVDETMWFHFDTKHKTDGRIEQSEAYISFDDFCIYNESNKRCYIDHLDLKSINWLIEKGYNLPFLSWKGSH